MNYYIETSNGRVSFQSEDILNMEIKNDRFQTSDGMYVYKNCELIGDSIEDIGDLYKDWYRMHVKETKNGLFLYITDCLGPLYAEYKIYVL